MGRVFGWPQGSRTLGPRAQGFRTSGPQSHDLAIIKLKPKGDGGAGFGVKMSAAVSPICIPEPGDLFKDDLPCVVSGWGQILRKYQKHALKKGWPLAIALAGSV